MIVAKQIVKTCGVIKQKMKKEKNKKQRKNSNKSWFLIILVSSFFLSLFFSYISTNALTGLDIIPAIIAILIVIFVGIIFDIIGLSVTVASEEQFHAQGTKKIKSAKTAIKLIRNAPKVSNFCADVIGDIAGVLSGAMSAIIAMKMTSNYGIDASVQYIISAIVASLTIGGKALGKGFAIKHSNKIVNGVSKVLSGVYK